MSIIPGTSLSIWSARVQGLWEEKIKILIYLFLSSKHPRKEGAASPITTFWNSQYNFIILEREKKMRESASIKYVLPRIWLGDKE